jgi:hypothetical protein
MSLRSLFIQSDESDKPKVDTPQPKVQQTTKFPTSTQATQTSPAPQAPSNGLFGFGVFGNSTPAPVPTNSQVSPEHLRKATEVYTQGFDSLNQSGYDFYEFYKSVVQTGVDNPQMYVMAYTMGSTMEKSLTKDKLVQQADYYVNEINKVYNDYVAKGSAKKQDYANQRSNENQSLLGELEMMNQQMEALKVQIQDRENKLRAIGSKYDPLIGDIENMLTANEVAKSQLISSIEQVKQGIINNVNH